MAVRAQDDPQYRMEIGAGVGMMTYEGDFNGNVLSDMQPAGFLVGRYNFDPYKDLKLSVGFGKIKGSSANVDTFYPDYAENPYSFNHTLVDMNLVFEYNFWPYGTGRDYRGAQRLVPYILGGLGATYVKGNEKNVFTANVPLGIGAKYKVNERLNLGLAWTFHFSLSDELDGVKVDEDYKRYYPYGSLASKVLGFTGGDNQGIIGLEVKYEEILKGQAGKILTTTDARGVEIDQIGESRENPVAGENLKISLDVDLQQYAQQAALKVMEEKQAARVSILLMNPQNGEIYVCVNVPEFDLNDPFTLNTDVDTSGLNEQEKQDLLNQM